MTPESQLALTREYLAAFFVGALGRTGGGGRDAKRVVEGRRRVWGDSGAFYLTPVPIRPRGERRFLRTFSPGVSFRPRHGFNPRQRRLSTSTDAFQLHPDVASRGPSTRSGGPPKRSRTARAGRAVRGRDRRRRRERRGRAVRRDAADGPADVARGGHAVRGRGREKKRACFRARHHRQ